MSDRPDLSAIRAAFGARWSALAPREQRGVQLAAVLVGASLVWWVALAPALATLKSAPSQHLALDRQLDNVVALQVRAQALQAQAAVASADALAALQADVAALGSGARLQLAGEQATVHLQKVRADVLAQWLVRPAAALRLQPVEVHWVRDAGGPDATWSGTLVFNVPAGNTSTR